MTGPGKALPGPIVWELDEGRYWIAEDRAYRDAVTATLARLDGAPSVSSLVICRADTGRLVAAAVDLVTRTPTLADLPEGTELP